MKKRKKRAKYWVLYYGAGWWWGGILMTPSGRTSHYVPDSGQAVCFTRRADAMKCIRELDLVDQNLTPEAVR